jgi:hypothetical protein
VDGIDKHFALQIPIKNKSHGLRFGKHNGHKPQPIPKSLHISAFSVSLSKTGRVSAKKKIRLHYINRDGMKHIS